MLVDKMIFLAAYGLTFIQLALTEWIEIPQTLASPKVESITKANDANKISSTTSTYITYATTEFPSTEEYLNQTMTAPILKDFNEDENPLFMNYVEQIQEKLLTNDHKTFENKIDILLDLKNNLLYNIKTKIRDLWSSRHTREARQYEKEEDYHMNFPSNEGALMTIGFLTFAVFLIKLVMKLITAIKDHKNGSMTTTTAAPATVLFGRKKRDVDDEIIRVLRYIDEFQFQ